MLVTLLALAAPAAAEDVWTEPAPGVRRLSRSDRYPYGDRPQYHLEALVIDLAHPAVRVVATPPEAAGGTVSQFADRLGLEAAWNTNFFGGPQDSCGLMMGEGQVWARAYQDGCHASIGLGDENQAAIFEQPEPAGPPPEGWMRQVATGKPGLVLRGGEPQYRYGCGTSCAYHPRTGIGLDQARRTLYVVVVDGRRPGWSAGAGLDDLANLMRELGAWDAVNLDGGGSSTLFVRGEGGVVNRPSDGRERVVCCHMGVRIDREAAWWRAERVDQSPVEAAWLPGQVGALWVRYRNTGRLAWRPDGPHPVRLGTQAPQDRESPWRGPDWIDATRTGPVEAGVEPGGEGTFRFEVRAPAPGRYAEAFAPVAEGASWMAGSPVVWDLEVSEPEPGGEPGDAAVEPPRVADAAWIDAARADDGGPDAVPPGPERDPDARVAERAPLDAAPRDDARHAGAASQNARHQGGCAAVGGGSAGWLTLLIPLLPMLRRRVPGRRPPRAGEGTPTGAPAMCGGHERVCGRSRLRGNPGHRKGHHLGRTG